MHLLPVASSPCIPGGGVMQARISAIQILYGIFVRMLFGVFEELCGYTLGIAPTVSHEQSLGAIHNLSACFQEVAQILSRQNL